MAVSPAGHHPLYGATAFPYIVSPAALRWGIARRPAAAGRPRRRRPGPLGMNLDTLRQDRRRRDDAGDPGPQGKVLVGLLAPGQDRFPRRCSLAVATGGVISRASHSRASKMPARTMAFSSPVSSPKPGFPQTTACTARGGTTAEPRDLGSPLAPAAPARGGCRPPTWNRSAGERRCGAPLFCPAKLSEVRPNKRLHPTQPAAGALWGLCRVWTPGPPRARPRLRIARGGPYCPPRPYEAAGRAGDPQAVGQTKSIVVPGVHPPTLGPIQPHHSSSRSLSAFHFPLHDGDQTSRKTV
jgi:hypothetical protein